MISRTLAATGTLLLLSLGLLASRAQAQNPVPFIDSLSPVSTEPGTQDLQLTIRGAGFSSGAKINFNGVTLTPGMVTASELTVTVPPSSLEAAGTANVTVVNPNAAPLLGVSNVAYFPITKPATLVSATRRAFSVPGTTSAQTQYVVSTSVGDFNGDGKLDIAVSYYVMEDRHVVETSLRIFVADGTGNFTLGSKVNVQGVPDALIVGDFNGDGNLDLAVWSYQVYPCPSTITSFLSDGNGNFATGPSTTLSTSYDTGPNSIVTGDFDGDGNLDLAVKAYESGRGYVVRILPGDGRGNFSMGSFALLGGFPSGIAVGDFNRDGKLDLAASTYDDGTVSILLGDGAGNFTSSTITLGQHADAVTTGDFNGDGNLDLRVTAEDYYIAPNSLVARTLLGDGNGNFGTGPPVSVSAAYGPATNGIGDFNGDGNLDLAVTVGILLGDGRGNLTTAAKLCDPTVAAAEEIETPTTCVITGVADFNGDGKLDFLGGNAPCRTDGGCYADGFSILLQAIPGPAPSIAPSPLDFGSHYLQRWINSYLTVTNRGTSALNITALKIVPDVTTSANEFRADLFPFFPYTEHMCVAPIGPAETCSVHVIFKASAAGPKGANLELTDNAASGIQTVRLTGTGVHTPIGITPSQLDFGSHHLGIWVNSCLFVTNLDTVPLKITNVSVAPSNEFVADLRWCGSPIAPGGTCLVHVAFRAISAGPKNATLTISHTADTAMQMVHFTGTGLAGP